MDTNGSYAWRTSQRSNLGTWHHFRCSTKTEVALLQQNRLHHCNEYLIATPKMLKQINQVNSYHEWIAEASYILFSLVLATQSACAIIVTFEGSSLELRSEHTLKRTGPAIQRLGSTSRDCFLGGLASSIRIPRVPYWHKEPYQKLTWKQHQNFLQIKAWESPTCGSECVTKV